LPRDGIYNVSLSDSSHLASSSEKPAAGGRRKSATANAAAGGRRKSATGREEQQKAKKTEEQPAAGGKAQAEAKKMPKKSATGGKVKVRGSVGLATQWPPKTMQEAATHSKATVTAMEKPLTQVPASSGNTSSYYSDESTSSAMEKPLTQKPATGGNTSSYYSDESASSAEPGIASLATQKQGRSASPSPACRRGKSRSPATGVYTVEFCHEAYFSRLLRKHAFHCTINDAAYKSDQVLMSPQTCLIPAPWEATSHSR